MAKATTKKAAKPDGEAVMREALEAIHKLGGQQGAIARQALITINTKRP